MKITLLLAMLILSTAPQRCEKDTDEDILVDETGFTAEDVKMREAFKDWEAFRKNADKIVMDARIQISEANDCYNDPDTPNRGKLKAAIIRAEERLEKLSDKMLKGRKYTNGYLLWNDTTLKEIQAFKEDFTVLHRQLDEALKELKERY